MSVSDETLMSHIKDGDMESFELLVKRWEQPLLNHCYRLLNNVELAEDLRQEIFLRVYRAAGTYQPTAKFSTWLYRIATNLCLDTLAKQRHRKTVPIDLASDDLDAKSIVHPVDKPDEIVERAEVERQVRLALKRLPENLRVIIIMRYYDGLKFREIAEILNCPVSTVKSRMAAGMRRLNQMLSALVNSDKEV
jgi:RNA polymerase sigma-70 factor (ECF subfamily)